MAIGTDDVYKTAEVVKLSEGKVVREAGPLPGLNTKITAILDPDGWKSVSPPHAHLQTFCFFQGTENCLLANRSETKPLRPFFLQVFVDNIDFAKELE